nr:ribonuclease H-like domain-containing protein [Tanacetum cinerariifolium]
MRMEQYLTRTDYALWEVIINGDAPAVIALVSGGAKAIVPPKTTAEKIARRNELKEKSTLLLAIPDEHLLKFHGIKDAKTLWEAIKIIFGGNKESKKIQKTILNLPPAWNTHTLIMRNKSDPDTLSKDDLYNTLKVYEAKIKGQSSSSLNSQSMAFVSSDNTNSTNEAVNTAHSVSAASSHKQASTSTYVDDVIECMAPRSQRNRNIDNTRRVVPVETPTIAFVVTDRIGYDWSYQAEEEPTDFALTAFLSLDSSSSDPEVNPQYTLKDQEIFDSGCSRHMMGNKSFLTDYQEIDGGFFAFRGSPKGGKILGKETECLVLSPDFKLPDENQILLKVHRQNNMYSFDLKNVVLTR